MRGKILLSLCLFLALPRFVGDQAHAFDWLGRIAIDADGLSSEDPQLRLKAVRSLRNYATEWTKEFLLDALSDENINVRTEAGRALANNKVAEAIPILILWLAEPDSASKEAAADILGEMKATEAIPALVRSLGDPDFKIRLRSTNALGKIGGSSVIVPLVTRLEDTKSDVRLAAVVQLKELGDTRSVIPLVGLFKDPSVKVRIAAHEAIGDLGDLSATPALLRSLDSRDDRVELASITSLGNLKALAALPRLMSAHARSNSALHAKISYSLAQIAAAHPKDPSAKRVLVALVEELGQRKTRSSAKEALHIAGLAAVPALLEQLQGRIAGDPTATVEILLQIADERATDALIAELDRGRVSQALLLSGLKKLGATQALLPVLALLNDRDPAVRLLAMDTLGSIVREDSAAADLIAERLEDDEVEIRNLAIRYLGRLRSQAAAPALEALAGDSPNLQSRALALAALTQIRSKSSGALGFSILRNGPHSLRALAADLLAEIADPQSLQPLIKLISESSDTAKSTLAIQVVGATLRDKKNQAIEELFLGLAVAPSLPRSLAAIEALVSMDADASSVLRQIAISAEPERRRAAIIALGATGDGQSRKLLRAALSAPGQKLAAAAAWSLAEIADNDAKAALFRALRSTKPALAINASAALATLANASDKEKLSLLLHNKISLVRVNAVIGLSGLKDVDTTRIQKLAEHDRSWLVRVAALRSLSRLGGAGNTLKAASENDRSANVRSVAKALLAEPFSPAPRSGWRVFRVIDPDQDDAPVRRTARFFVGNDGVATVSFSDHRGRIVYEHFPHGEFVEGALDNLARY